MYRKSSLSIFVLCYFHLRAHFLTLIRSFHLWRVFFILTWLGCLLVRGRVGGAEEEAEGPEAGPQEVGRGGRRPRQQGAQE